MFEAKVQLLCFFHWKAKMHTSDPGRVKIWWQEGWTNSNVPGVTIPYPYRNNGQKINITQSQKQHISDEI